MKNVSLKIAAVSLSALAVVACDSSSTTATPTSTPAASATTASTSTKATVSVDASDRNNYVYYKLDDLMASKLTVSNQATDTEWDIAFKRTGVILNSGASGSGSIEAAMAEAQSQFYTSGTTANSSVFMNATAAQEGKTAFDKVTASTDLSALTFSQDTNSNAIDSTKWWSYNPTTHVVSAISSNGWVVRSSDGNSHAKFFVKSFTTTGRNLDVLTINMAVQPNGGTFGAASDRTISTGGAVTCYDFDTDANVDCNTSSAWDLRVDPTGSYKIWLNSAVYGKGQGAIAFGALDVTTSNYTSPNTATVGHWVTDTTKGVFTDNSWYAYNLGGNHKIWPNFRVYVIKDGSSYYKLQLQSYYNTSSVSGHLTVSVEKLK